MSYTSILPKAAAVAALIAIAAAPSAVAAPRGGDLYVATAGGGRLAPTARPDIYRLTLRRPSAQVVAFAEHPERNSRSESLKGFVSGWAPAGLAEVPPNAALVLDGAPADRDVVVLELGSPRITRRGALTFRARRVGGPAPGALGAFSRRADAHVSRSFGRASLFVDAGAPPAVPVIVYVSVPAAANLSIDFDRPFADGPLVWRAREPGGLSLGTERVLVSASQSPLSGRLFGYASTAVGVLSGTMTIPAGASVAVQIADRPAVPVAGGAFSIPLQVQ